MDRVLVCSDIHGCLDKLNSALEQANYDARSDQLLILGDYIDRGIDSRGVIKRVQELQTRGAITLRGNHEDMCISAIRNPNAVDRHLDLQLWVHNGGDATLASYEEYLSELEEDVIWMESLPLYHETDDFIFVHGSPKPFVPMSKQTLTDMIWGRHNNACGLGKLVVHGHTPVKQPSQIHDQLFIDTGAVFGGVLTVVDVMNGGVWIA